MNCELKYNAEKIIELLVPALEVLNETSCLENRRHTLFSNIYNKRPDKPTEAKIDIPEIPEKPRYIHKNRGILFKFIAKSSDSICAIGLLISTILLFSFLIVSFQQYEYLRMTYLVIFILSCISLVFFLLLFIAKKIVAYIDKKDQKLEMENKLLIDKFIHQQRERDRIIKYNEYIDLERKEYLEKLRFYNDNVLSWERELAQVERKIMLYNQCIDDVLDFVPIKYRNYETLVALIIILKNHRADNFKEAINIYEKDKYLEKILRYQK